jgi:hypothetical protein
MTATATQTLDAQTFGLGIRKILLLDALTGLAMGLLLVASAGVLSALLGLPKDFVLAAGLALLVFFVVLWLASRAGAGVKPPVFVTWLVILGNAAWVVASALTITLWFSPTLLGSGFVGFQALVVLVLTLMQYRGR